MGLVGDLLEKAARATPAVIEDRRAGWWLRHTDDATWWSGAVLAHGAPDGLARHIDAAERFYAERDAVSRFQVCPDCPAALDQALSERGYRVEAPISLLTAMAATPSEERAPPGVTVCLDTSLQRDWLAVLSATSAPGTDVEHETSLLPRIDLPHVYVTVFADDEPVGIGRAVVEGGWSGIFNMATKPQARRQGVARQVLSTIAGWADAHAAPQLYLQVERSNIGARQLYESAGFTELATYHYRVRDNDTSR